MGWQSRALVILRARILRRLNGNILLGWVIYSLLSLGLVACGGDAYRAPVEDRRIKPQAVPAGYSVQRGDTLYSIAWRYGLDFRTVASNNNIPRPYTIYPGQRIYLGQKPPPRAKPVPGPTPVTKSTASGAAGPGVKTVTKTSTAPKKPPAAAKSSAVKKANTTVSNWRWPTSGRVTRGYSATVHKGIDIDGKRGDAIYAVAAGRVVYAGAGIVGYGELLIVKHNEVYLSAYGHNSRLLVAEGQQVKAGQKIAQKGSSGTNTVKLHFEIRKEGKPIDPKRLLPAK